MRPFFEQEIPETPKRWSEFFAHECNLGAEAISFGMFGLYGQLIFSDVSIGRMIRVVNEMGRRQWPLTNTKQLKTVIREIK